MLLHKHADEVFEEVEVLSLKISSTGYFAIGDIYKGKDLATALNKTTKDGGNICLLQNNDLARLVKALINDLKARCPVYRRELVTVFGLQEGSKVMVINPDQVIFVETGELTDIEETSFVCIGKRRQHMERSLKQSTSTLPLGLFFDTALRVLGRKTFGVAILAWCAMYTLNIYGWILQHLRHFNLPMLFGEPMVGKSLIASCAAWLNGCPKTAIVSRATLPYVTSMVTTSTLPFVWDDPSTSEEVSQLAIDLGNEAVRGKIFSETLTPKTGCLVTANFDMSDMLKYFSRLVVLYVEKSTKTKVGGDAMVLEEHAKAASAALPMVMQVLTTKLDIEDVHNECRRLKVMLPVEMRILEGIALNVYVTRQILNLAGRYGYMKLVNEYVHETMIPYYKRQLSSATLPREPNVQAPTNNDVQSVIYVEKITTNTAAIIKGGSVLAVDQSIIREIDTIGNYGAVRNKPTKINGRTRKMVHIPTRNLHPDLVREVEKCLGPTETTAPSTPTASATTSTRTTPEILTTAHTPTSEPQDSPPTTSATTSTRTTAEVKTTSHTPRSTSEPQDSPPTTSATTSTPTTPEIKTTSHTPRSTSETQEAPVSTSLTDQRHTPPAATPLQTVSTHSNKAPVQLVKGKRKLDMLLLPTEVSADELCKKCFKRGRSGMRWVECEICEQWYHATCMEIGRTQYMKIQRNETTWECC